MTQHLHAAAIEKAQTVWLENSNRFQGFQYEDRHTIRDMRKPAGEQVVWELAQGVNTPAEYERCHEAMMVEIERLQWAEVVKALLGDTAPEPGEPEPGDVNETLSMLGDAVDPWAEGLWRAARETLALHLFAGDNAGEMFKWKWRTPDERDEYRARAQAIMEGRGDA